MKTVTLAAALCLTSLGCARDTDALDLTEEGSSSDALRPIRVEVCHIDEDGVGRILLLPQRAADAHARHGDLPAEAERCDGRDNDCNGVVDDGIDCEAAEGEVAEGETGEGEGELAQ
jgi:hypothetical protein